MAAKFAQKIIGPSYAVEMRAEALEVEGLSLAIGKRLTQDNWLVVDRETGARIQEGKTKAEAIANARNAIAHGGIEAHRAHVARCAERHGAK